MPYPSNRELPPSVRSRYSERCQRAFRHAFNGTYHKQGETRAFQAGHAAARRCTESKSMENLGFNITSGLLKAYQGKDGKRRLKTVASSSITDRSGDVMTENAIRKMAASAKENMTIFLNHSYKVPEDVFGSVEDVAVVHRGDVWDLEFDVRLNEANERALKTYDAIENGTKLGTSIGAKINEGGATRNDGGGYTFDDISLLEASIVALPSNPRSWVQHAIKAMEIAAAEEEEDDVLYQTMTSNSTPPTVTFKVESEVPVLKQDEPEAPETSENDGSGQPDPSLDLPPGESDQETETPEEAPAEEPAPEDTPEPAQDGQATEPEAADGEAPDESPDETVLAGAFGALKIATSELVDLRKELTRQTEARVRAETERDAAVADLKKAQAIIEQVASLPIGRRHGFDEGIRDFRARFSNLYSDDFLKLLETDSE